VLFSLQCLGVKVTAPLSSIGAAVPQFLKSLPLTNSMLLAWNAEESLCPCLIGPGIILMNIGDGLASKMPIWMQERLFLIKQHAFWKLKLH